MSTREFDIFRLVGGTALCLRRGHRQSADIDLFSDAIYGSIKFDEIYAFLSKKYPYADSNNTGLTGMGKSFYIGESKSNCIKLDLFYTDSFIDPVTILDGIRFASIEDIIAMKVDVISRGGRMKDFWDIHELIDDYTFNQMLLLHKKRYPFNHDRNSITKSFTDFKSSDFDFKPICLKSKHWEIIKLDILDFVKEIL